jgi:hypothetical protein
MLFFALAPPLFAGPLTPTPTATPTSTPTPTPTACIDMNPVITIHTIGKGQNAANNNKVIHAITGNIVDPTSLGTTAHRIPICAGTPVSIAVSDSTGAPKNQAQTAGIVCNPAGCTVASLLAKDKYISRSRDGKDTDRMTLLPK